MTPGSIRRGRPIDVLTPGAYFAGCNLSGCAEATVVSPNPVEGNRGCCEVCRAEQDIPSANIGPGG
jgi:hypothetical protein